MDRDPVSIPSQPLPAWADAIGERLIYPAVTIFFFFLLAAVPIGEWAARRAMADEHGR